MANPRIASTLLIDTMKSLRCYDNFIPKLTNDVEVLDTHAFDPNAIDVIGETPLSIAASYGHFEIVRWLVELDAMIDTPHSHNKTPLMIAAEKGLATKDDFLKNAYYKIVKYLVERGAKINEELIHLAHANKHTQIAEFLSPAKHWSTSHVHPFGFLSPTKPEAICKELNRISKHLRLPKWQYKLHTITSDIVCIHLLNPEENAGLAILKNHLDENHVAYQFNPTSFYIENPDLAKLKLISTVHNPEKAHPHHHKKK